MRVGRTGIQLDGPCEFLVSFPPIPVLNKSDRPERFVPMLNAARSPTFYEFDSADLLRLYRDLDARDEEPVVVYHSHTATEAFPSRTDVAYASEPGAHYLLVSTREPDQDEVRSFRIVDGEITEEEVRVVATLETADAVDAGDTSA